VGSEPTISVLERAKTVRALDRAATAIGNLYNELIYFTKMNRKEIDESEKLGEQSLY
jgi:hypothetical protein